MRYIFIDMKLKNMFNLFKKEMNETNTKNNLDDSITIDIINNANTIKLICIVNTQTTQVNFSGPLYVGILSVQFISHILKFENQDGMICNIFNLKQEAIIDYQFSCNKKINQYMTLGGAGNDLLSFTHYIHESQQGQNIFDYSYNIPDLSDDLKITLKEYLLKYVTINRIPMINNNILIQQSMKIKNIFLQPLSSTTFVDPQTSKNQQVIEFELY